MKLLVLGGTREARDVAAGAVSAGHEVTTSLAGRTSAPREVAGDVRVGGFGGAEGLARWLREHRAEAVIDATHPFAVRISAAAADACRATGTPLLALRRPAVEPGPGDDWTRVADAEAAARALPSGARVLLTLGRQRLDPFMQRRDVWYLARMVDPPGDPLPPTMQALIGRGPFTLDEERELLRTHAISVLVTRDAGGVAAAPKLTAARERGVPVMVIDRPRTPQGVRSASDAQAVLTWLHTLHLQTRVTRGSSSS